MGGVASERSMIETNVDLAVPCLVNCFPDAAEAVVNSYSQDNDYPVAVQYQEYLMYAVYLERSGYAVDEPRHQQMKTMADDDEERNRFAHSGPAKQEYHLWGERAGVALVPLVEIDPAVGCAGSALFALFPR